jgi:hypothetical protein
VIRRGFWLATGAVLGVAGYRRLTRLARALTGDGVSRGSPADAGLLRTQLTPERRDGGTGSASTVSAGSVSASSGANGAGQRERQPRPGTIARVAATVSFIRDVRAGMAEYWDLRRPELARNLRSRSDRISSGRSGASGQGVSEP